MLGEGVDHGRPLLWRAGAAGARGSGPPARGGPPSAGEGRRPARGLQYRGGRPADPDRARAGRRFYPRLIRIESCSPSPCAPGRLRATATATAPALHQVAAAPAPSGAAPAGRGLHRIEIPAMLACRVAEACRPPGTSSMRRRRDLRMPPPCPPPRAGRTLIRAPILALILAAGFVTGFVAGLVTGPAASERRRRRGRGRRWRRPVDPAAEAALFAMPAHRRGEPRRARTAQAGDLAAAAAAMLDALVGAHPGVGLPAGQPRRARHAAGETETALALIEAAAAHGFPGLARWLADPLFAPLAGDPRSRAGGAPRRRARPPVPAPVADGMALVSGANTAWNPAAERLEPRFAFPDEPDAPVLPPRPKARRLGHPARALAARPRRRQPRRSLRQPRPRPLPPRPGGASRRSPPSPTPRPPAPPTSTTG